MKSFSLTVQNPCQEKWETFKSTGSGGFCAGCQKEVIDFTNWSDEQIIQHLSKGNDSGCGRFKHSQLKIYRTESNQSFKIKHWIYTSFVTLNLLFFSQRGEAHIVKKQTASESIEVIPIRDKAIVIHDSLVIKGTVRSFEDSTGLAGVKIYARSTTIFAETDNSGRFELTIPNSVIIDSLEFSHPNFFTDVRLAQFKEIDVYLYPYSFELTGVIGGYVSYRPWRLRSIWWRVKNLFRRNR